MRQAVWSAAFHLRQTCDNLCIDAACGAYFLAVGTDETEADLVNGLKEICESDVVENGLVILA